VSRSPGGDQAEAGPARSVPTRAGVPQRFAFAELWTAFVFLAAMIGAALFRSKGLGPALEVAVVILVVACPCALSLATPLALASAVAQAAKRGVLVRDPSAFSRLNRLEAVALDKTGTLTLGHPEVCAESRYCDKEQIKRTLESLYAIESLSLHPHARAICEHLEASARVEGLELAGLSAAAKSVQALRGLGLRGEALGLELQVLRAGSEPQPFGAERPTEMAFVSLTLEQEALIEAIQARGESCACVWGSVREDSGPFKLLLIFAFRDQLRFDAKGTLDALREEFGLRLSLLSGDNHGAVQKVAAALGIEAFFADQSPEEKRQVLESMAASGGVAMVGDGLNDLGALQAASVAVAVASASPQAIAKSDVVLQGLGVRGLLELMRLAARTRSVIRVNAIFAFCYNLIGVGLAMAGQISPLVAALLMPLSSLTVVSFALFAMGRPLPQGSDKSFSQLKNQPQEAAS